MRRTVGGSPYRGTFTAAVFTTWYFTALGIFSCENFKKEIQVIHSKKINVLTHYNAKVLSMTLIWVIRAQHFIPRQGLSLHDCDNQALN